MGIISDIQQRVSALIGPKGVRREANAAFEKFMVVASMRESELNDAISKLKTISDIGTRIGRDTEKRLGGLKANTPLNDFATNGGDASHAKIYRSQQLNADFSEMLRFDKTGYAELYADAQDIREGYQSSPLTRLSNEAKGNALSAVFRCEAAGAGNLADSLRLEIDAKQCAIDTARDGVISQFRFAAEDLAKNDPQTLIKAELTRQDALIEATERQARIRDTLPASPAHQELRGVELRMSEETQAHEP